MATSTLANVVSWTDAPEEQTTLGLGAQAHHAENDRKCARLYDGFAAR